MDSLKEKMATERSKYTAMYTVYLIWGIIEDSRESWKNGSFARITMPLDLLDETSRTMRWIHAFDGAPPSDEKVKLIFCGAAIISNYTKGTIS